MAAPDHSKVFGLTDLAVATLTGETVGSLVDLPGVRSLDLTIATDSEQLRGDGKVISVFDKGSSVEWSVEEGGFSMQAAEIITGKTATDSGSGATEVARLDIKATDIRPYFFLVGKAPDDATGDVHAVVWRAKATGNIAWSFADEAFLTPTMEGTGVGRVSDDLLASIVQHETAAVLAVPA